MCIYRFTVTGGFVLGERCRFLPLLGRGHLAPGLTLAGCWYVCYTEKTFSTSEKFFSPLSAPQNEAVYSTTSRRHTESVLFSIYRVVFKPCSSQRLLTGKHLPDRRSRTVQSPPPLPGPPAPPDTAAGPPQGRGAGKGEAEKSPATLGKTKGQLHRGPGPCLRSDARGGTPSSGPSLRVPDRHSGIPFWQLLFPAPSPRQPFTFLFFLTSNRYESKYCHRIWRLHMNASIARVPLLSAPRGCEVGRR